MVRNVALSRLKRGLNPRNVAVVGAARHNNFGWIKRHLPFQEKHGKLFHVNINQDEWPGAQELGVQNFSTLTEIEDPIDYVSVSVPRHVVPAVLADCIKKDVAVVHIFTSGFEESGEAEGIKLDETIREMALSSGILIIGPNCLGLYDPAIGIRQTEAQPYGDSGYFGYISNSGSQSVGLTTNAYSHGIMMSKCFSMGNGMVLDQADYLDYLADDDATRIIGLYIEGIRDPQRFFNSLSEASKKKPVIVWKVGQTEDAARATAAHSGAPYIRQELWSSLIARCGALEVNSVDEMVDTAKALSLLTHANGYNMALIAAAGGHSTEMANVFSKTGFKIGPFTDQSYKELSSFLHLIGGNYVNPIEGGASGQHLGQILELLGRDLNTDIVCLELMTRRLGESNDFLSDIIKSIKDFQKHSHKPIAIVLDTSLSKVDSEVVENSDWKFSQAGIPAFYSFQRGARSMKNALDFFAVNKYLGS